MIKSKTVRRAKLFEYKQLQKESKRIEQKKKQLKAELQVIELHC